MTTLDDEAIHEAACRAGAVVMGSSDDLADLHYLLNAERLRAFLNAPRHRYYVDNKHCVFTVGGMADPFGETKKRLLLSKWRPTKRRANTRATTARTAF
jgi:hypothetical protein